MTSRSFYWNLSFVFLFISIVSSREDLFYKISAHDVSILKTDIVTLPNTRIKRAEPLITKPNTNNTNIPISTNLSNNGTNLSTSTTTISTSTAATTHKINSSIQTNIDKYNGTKTLKEVQHLSATSVVLNGSDNIIGSNLSTVNQEPPAQGNSGNLSYKGFFDVEFPSPITNETLVDHNITKTKNDSHIYYNSTTVNGKSVFEHYWVDLKSSPDTKVHEMLSDSHRRAATINLKFLFPFYGHLMNSTTIATGGFLYLGEYIHSWLAATQYIAPLMANFDLSTSNHSNIYYMDNGTALTITWHDVTLQDSQKIGGFTFQTTLYSNGNIVFAYKNLPIKISEIDSTNHPVKIGLSDAYVLDKTMFFVRRKTIYEYHRVTFHEDEIMNGTVIILTALPTCMEKKNCSSCVKKDTNFQCYWCDKRCSSGIDRFRQEWHKKDCEKLKLTDEDMCLNGVSTHINSNEDNSVVESSVKSEFHTNNSSSSTSLFFIALCVSLIIMSTAWIMYAYLNPHTRSGQMLIRYRPNQWGWRKGEARYTAATIHM